MTNQEGIKEKIRELIQDFRSNYKYYKSLPEADIETKLVESLFVDILGWTKKDFNKQEATRRGTKRGRADYAFKIKDKIVFFLEVKKVGIPLDKEADKQVVSYALSKRVPFAVSTNFEELKIFCVEQEDATKKVFRIFKKPEDYIENFHDLIFLTKESFEKKLILKKAEDEGRLRKRISIDKTLLEDLMIIRNLIINDIEKTSPKKYEPNEKDDIAQRIIDRLIFIRKCEDTNINPDNLILEEIKNLSDDKAYSKLKSIFKRYNEVYNSGLFAIAKDNDCDNININGKIIKKLIGYLYESKDKEYIYNFDWIDADVLGLVYEQYLGKILAQTRAGRVKLKKGQAHRKEQGIYYTPTYIVDYIIKNTLGELLKEKKVKVKELKILDPACGSGSFLIKTFDYLCENLSSDKESKQTKLDEQGSYSIKTEILKNNIFGVDLDNKAVEITKLNLLLKAAEKYRKLPNELDQHIQHGNSLIDNEEIAGLDAFKWEDKFEEGSFDVVVGNPPYVQLSMEHNFSKNSKTYLINRFGSSMGRLNTFGFFIKLGINLLKEKGRLGFIVPNTILTQDYYEKLRETILSSCKIELIVNFSDLPFKDAIVENIIIILKKSNSKKERLSNKIAIFGVNEDLCFVKQREISQKAIPQNNKKSINILLDSNMINLKNKIENKTERLEKFLDANQAIALKKDRAKYLTKEKMNNQYKKVLDGRHINRYSLNWDGFYLKYDVQAIHSCKREDIFLSKEKLFFRRVGKRLTATFDDKQFYALNTLVVMNKRPGIDVDIKYFLGLFNSKLMDYYYISFLKSTKTIFSEIQARQIKSLPIKIAPKSDQKRLITLVDKIIFLNEQISEIGDKKTTKTVKLEREIKKIDKEIDEIVYKLYGITEKEKKIIEESLK